MSTGARSATAPLVDLLARARSDASWWGVMIGAAVCGHAAFAAALPRGAARTPSGRAPVQLIDVDPPVLPPPASPPPEAQRLPSVEPQAAPHAPRRAALTPVRPSPPSPLVPQPTIADDLGVVDFTDSVVQGSGTTAAGGGPTVDAPAAAYSARAREPPRTQSSWPPTETADLSRRPALAGTAEWTCPFPPEADRAGVDSAVVAIRVALDASGAVRDVGLQSDPGHGFGPAAEKCAKTKRWTPALDRAGHAVDGLVMIRVRFRRD